MAGNGRSSSSKNVSWDFNAALTSAVFEWLLIFMLYIHAVFSYLITKFAYYCKLQVPCLLCSRLDHIISNKNRGFYWDLICGNHKLEISSLVLCHVHNKLTDVHGICENCLFSFATINKSNAETYRLLVGKLGEYPEDPFHEHHRGGSSTTKQCSCCNEPWVSKGRTYKFLQTRSLSSDGADQNQLTRKRDRSTVAVSAAHFGKDVSDPLSHVRYTEVKITSDTETDGQFSDDDASTLAPEMVDRKEDISVECIQIQPRNVILAGEFVYEKLIDPVFEHDPSLLLSKENSDDIAADVGTLVAPTVVIEHGLKELNFQHTECKAESSPVTELISFDDIPPSSNSAETIIQVTKEILDPVEPGDVEKACLPDFGGISKVETDPVTSNETGVEIKIDTGFQIPSYLDLGDAYKLAVSNRGRQLFDKQLSMNKSPRVSEDLRLLLSQLSATRGIDLPMPDMSPRVYGNNNDDIKRITLERNESGFESLDGSVVSEIEGESVISRCKRQIDHDRKLLGGLYKELEEERNASSIAANQAMAMITRLQEEKAELHMEALQYLRMMEEQSEYDMEALQRSNVLLAEREKEIQDLEAELESYKMKSSNLVTRKPILHRESKLNESLLEFEDEKIYISNCLKKLEEKLHLFSNNGAYLDIVNGDYRTKYDGNHKDMTEKNSEQENNGSSAHIQEEFSIYESSQESKEFFSDKKVSSLVFGENDLVGLANAVSDLNNRLETLETDRDFLEKIIISVKSGDGLDFVQEIASHLRELRRIVVRRNGEDFS